MQVPGWTYSERQGWNDLKQSLSSCWACVRAKSLQSCLTLCDPWTVAHQAPLSMGFSMQEYRSRLPSPPPGDLPNPGTEPTALTSQVYKSQRSIFPVNIQQYSITNWRNKDSIMFIFQNVKIHLLEAGNSKDLKESYQFSDKKLWVISFNGL